MSCDYKNPHGAHCRMVLTAGGDLHMFNEEGKCYLKHNEAEEKLLEAFLTTWIQPVNTMEDDDVE